MVMKIIKYKTWVIDELSSCKEELITQVWRFREVEVYDMGTLFGQYSVFI